MYNLKTYVDSLILRAWTSKIDLFLRVADSLKMVILGDE